MRRSWRADLIALLTGTAAGAVMLADGGRAAMALLRLDGLRAVAADNLPGHAPTA